MWRQLRHQKIFKKCKNYPNIALFGLILKQIACRFQKWSPLLYLRSSSYFEYHDDLVAMVKLN